MRCEIIYEDGELLVVRKPAGLATQSGAVGQADAVSELKGYLARQARDGTESARSQAGKAKSRAEQEKDGQEGRKASASEAYLGIVHRLDQPVEGLLVFAKTPKSAAVLSKQLGQGALNKRYLALVCGKPRPEEGTLVDYLRKDGGKAEVVTGKESKYFDAKLAMLSYRILPESELRNVLEPDADQTKDEEKEENKKLPAYSVLEVEIETGRFHQIRAQLSHAGWPIAGDRKYGNAASDILARELGIGSVALCACELECKHPATGRHMSWTCKPRWLTQ